METFGILGFVFGMMGFIAFCGMGSLRSRIKKLEDELASMSGTSYSLQRESLAKIAKDSIGKNVKLQFNENCYDSDIVFLGPNSSVKILDADDKWILIEYEIRKRQVKRLIRADSIKAIQEV